MLIGSAYYPNELSLAEIKRDVLLMKQAGFNVERIGDLIYSSIESEEGKFNIKLLYATIHVLFKHLREITFASKYYPSN